MNTFQPLDIYQVPLSDLTLIEAGAGTGKTWTITGLYLRLLLQQGLNVEQILLVTYTKAATAELHERIRARLADMLTAVQTGVSDDVFCATLLQDMDADQRSKAQRRLTRAISGFDEAAIFTIHGFCQRALADHAFEAGHGFEQELLPDERDLLRELVDDFWRRELHTAHAAWVDFLVDSGQTPDVWLAEIAAHVGKPYLQVTDAANSVDEALLETVQQVYAQAQTLWREQREEIIGLLLDGNLDGNKYRASSVPQWGSEFDDYFAADNASVLVPDKLDKLTPAALSGAVKKGRNPPEHIFFQACAALLDAVSALVVLFNAKLAASKAALLAWCNAELPKRKTALQVLSYNDLLNRLAEALQAEHGAHLAQGLRERYRAALIDEFQDTDPVQYRIFQAIYGKSGDNSWDLPVFFVGDPKQAIYSFRGADVYSYLEARQHAERRYTLDTNQRSVPALISAVNTLFGHHAAPFMLEDIGYRPAAASPREKPLLQVDEEDGIPFRFILLPAPVGTKPWSKDKAAELAALATAADIARLLGLAAQGKARLEGPTPQERGAFLPVTGGDIAVLVSTHHQGRRIELALRELGIASVRQGQDSVYASHEALQLERVLLAVAEPGREPLVKAALAGELMGWNGAAIFALQTDEAAWEQQLERFQRYHALWRDHGFMPMLRAWLDESAVAEHLLSLVDGERRLTNLLHLAELLQVASHERPGLDALLSWFGRKLHSPERGEEVALLRLESDAERVKIVTIHTSKGLEYPVVYCPFLWDGSLLRKGEASFAYHDTEHQPRLAFQADAAVYAQVSQERLAEKMRLLYVALTRAKQRCSVVWGHISGMEHAALFWLLHGADCAQLAEPLSALTQRAKALNNAAILAELEERILMAPQALCWMEAVTVAEPCSVQPEPVENLQVRHFSRGALQPSWRMTSFSALSAGRHSEMPDYDASSGAPSQDIPTVDSMFTFPRGATAGTCLHAIFEEWEFQRHDRAAMEQLVSRKLIAHALDERWTTVVADMLSRVLDTPLDGKALRLNQLAPQQRLVELEFTFTLQNLQAQRLRELLLDSGYGLAAPLAQASRQLAFDAVQGYMKGFIDLVFQADGRYYLLDWKSNWLGNRLADYAPAHLLQAIAREHYYLQYLIYCLALHRYLRLRQPDYDYERHFGGVFYLFLRGIRANSSDTGIYSDRPSAALINALDGLFSGKQR